MTATPITYGRRELPNQLREVAPEGLAALSFLTDDYRGVQRRARAMVDDVTVLFGDVPGVDLFSRTLGGVPIEFMGGCHADHVENLPAAPSQG
jgi:hypothetical protein